MMPRGIFATCHEQFQRTQRVHNLRADSTPYDLGCKPALGLRAKNASTERFSEQRNDNVSSPWSPLSPGLGWGPALPFPDDDLGDR